MAEPLQLGEKIAIAVRGRAASGVVFARVIGFHEEHLKVEECVRPWHYTYASEGVVWCRNNPEAVAALQVATALGAAA